MLSSATMENFNACFVWFFFYQHLFYTNLLLMYLLYIRFQYIQNENLGIVHALEDSEPAKKRKCTPIVWMRVSNIFINCQFLSAEVYYT